MFDSAGIKLRRVERSDVPKLWSWHTEQELYLFSGLRSHLSQSDLERDFYTLFGHKWDYIIESQQGVLLGICTYDRIDWKNRFCTIWFQRYFKVEDKVAVLMGLKQMLSFLFMNMNLNKVQAHALDSMTDEHDLLIEAGFELEGLLREHIYSIGQYHDVRLLALHRDNA